MVINPGWIDVPGGNWKEPVEHMNDNSEETAEEFNEYCELYGLDPQLTESWESFYSWIKEREHHYQAWLVYRNNDISSWDPFYRENYLEEL